MNVSAIIVTRGNVDLHPVLDSLPKEWERVVWDNSGASSSQEALEKAALGSGFVGENGKWMTATNDLSVYGRYASIEHASHDLIYVQDDDVIVSDPQAIVDMWDEMRALAEIEQDPTPEGFLVANMPQEFRHDGYTDSCLVGFGACFHRDLPARAFERFLGGLPPGGIWFDQYRRPEWGEARIDEALFRRTCDVVFTTLTPRVLVDVPKTDREFASDDDRMWKQPGHFGERTRMLELARMVRDA